MRLRGGAGGPTTSLAGWWRQTSSQAAPPPSHGRRSSGGVLPSCSSPAPWPPPPAPPPSTHRSSKALVGGASSWPATPAPWRGGLGERGEVGRFEGGGAGRHAGGGAVGHGAGSPGRPECPAASLLPTSQGFSVTLVPPPSHLPLPSPPPRYWTSISRHNSSPVPLSAPGSPAHPSLHTAGHLPPATGVGVSLLPRRQLVSGGLRKSRDRGPTCPPTPPILPSCHTAEGTHKRTFTVQLGLSRCPFFYRLVLLCMGKEAT